MVRYYITADNSGHKYYVPWSKRKEWSAWLDLDEDDPASWDVPEWAKRMNGGWTTFVDPQTLGWDDDGPEAVEGVRDWEGEMSD